MTNSSADCFAVTISLWSLDFQPTLNSDLSPTGATHVQLGLSSQLLEDNRLPGLLEDRRVLQPGSSLLLKRSSLTLELLISYSSSTGASASASSNIGTKEADTEEAKSYHLQSSSHSRHVIDHVGETAKAVCDTSNNLDGQCPGTECDAACLIDPVETVVAQVSVPKERKRVNRVLPGARGLQADGILMVQVSSSGVPVHRCDC